MHVKEDSQIHMNNAEVWLGFLGIICIMVQSLLYQKAMMSSDSSSESSDKIVF